MGKYDGMKCDFCDSSKHLRKHNGEHMVCSTHRNHLRRYGMIRPDKEKKPRELIEKENHIEIIFKNGEIGLFDKEDRELLKKARWFLDVEGYPVGKADGINARYHRHLMKHPKMIVDHINRNRLDNRKANLRLCTIAENVRNAGINKNNTSGYTGVYKLSKNKWRAAIGVDGKSIHLGHFDNIEDAVKARRDAELKYFKEFAPCYLEEVNKLA